MDPHKLKALTDEQNERPVNAGGGEDPHDEEHEAGEQQAAADLSSEAMQGRLSSPHIGYMELDAGWGDGGCGNCRFSTPEGFCAHPEVQAYVSPDAGCCNEFNPKDEDVIVPPEAWEAKKMAEESGFEPEPKKTESEEEPEAEEA